MNLIIEGLTGAGKSQIISHLKIIENNTLSNYQIIYETETFGKLMLEIEEKNSDKEKIYRLNNCLDKIKNSKEQKFILERFHFSYFPFLNNWELYKEMDQQLKDLNFFIILLTYNEELLEERALNHYEVLNSIGSKAVIEYFGSKQNALSAYKESQKKRIECLKYTSLEYLEIDTSEMKWQNYAEKILESIKI